MSNHLLTYSTRAVSSLVVRGPEDLVPCLNCGGGDSGVAIYRSSGNFAELIHTVTCMVLKANDRRTPFVTMNSVGLDLTADP
ncbi:hypothetical protein TNCV_955031 [Trichonephila clavipes]|nr:hypothetical protein TNCV_955031 [Trichonephila clavipes]